MKRNHNFIFIYMWYSIIKICNFSLKYI
jgi:hypothetical protein